MIIKKLANAEKTQETLEKISGKKLTLANTIWAIRECEEMTQTDFAKLLGVSRQYLCDIEKGRKAVSPKFAEEFAIRLGYSCEQFVRLALQDELRRDGLKYEIELTTSRRAA